MYRSETWSKGFYIDNHDKCQCLDCNSQYIVGRKLLENSKRETPICPYCGSNITEIVSGTETEQLEELASELGCLGIYIDKELQEE